MNAKAILKSKPAQYIYLGLTAAATVALLDGILTRVPSLNGRPLGRAVGRLGAAAALAYGAHRLGAPCYIAGGIVAGPVMVTALDIAVAQLPRNRVEPPVLPSGTPLALAGLPWGPRLPYSLAGR